MKANQIVFILLWMLSVPFIAVAQDGGGSSGNSDGGDGGGETKIWEPDLVELWIYWHKQQYRMFECFSHNEDTLMTVQHENYRNWMRKLREVDEILFKQYQDNDIPKTPFFIPNSLHVVYLTDNLTKIVMNTGEMLDKPPVDAHLQALWAEALLKTLVRYIALGQATLKYLNGWQKTNLRDNDFRDNLSDYIIKELETMIGDWNQLYRKTQIAKYLNLTPLK